MEFFPFTIDELIQAFMLVLPEDQAAEVARSLITKESVQGVSIFEGTFLVIAAVSDELAAKVVSLRPDLESQVNDVRLHKNEYLAAWRKELHDQG